MDWHGRKRVGVDCVMFMMMNLAGDINQRRRIRIQQLRSDSIKMEREVQLSACWIKGAHVVVGLHDLLELAHESRLLGSSLESTMSEFGGCIDKLQVDLFQVTSRSMSHKRFPQCDNTLLDTGHRSLEIVRVRIRSPVYLVKTVGMRRLTFSIRKSFVTTP